MNLYIFDYVVIICISGVITFLLGILAYVKRSTFSGSTTFILICITSCIYIFGHALELTGSTFTEIDGMIKLQYLGLPFIPPLNVVLAMQFLGFDRYLTKRNLVLLFVVPLTSVTAVLTNNSHHLFYKAIILKNVGSWVLADLEIGPFYVIHGSYTFGSLFACICILFAYGKKVKSSYRLQLGAMIVASLLPMIASFLYLMGQAPYNMDPVPAVMCITSTLYVIAILSSDMLVIAPIAKDYVFEHMRDGVLVLDPSNHIVDYNAVASRMLGGLNRFSMGQRVEDVWDAQMIETDLPDWQQEKDEEIKREIEWKTESGTEFVLFHIYPLYKKNGVLAGRTILLSNITSERLLREDLETRAYKDGLTNSFNRSYLVEKGEAYIRSYREDQRALSLIIFDIDHFKSINDTYGHEAGDETIKYVVSTTQKLLDEHVILSRYGGEEFVVLLPDMMLHEAVHIAEQIRKRFEQRPFYYETTAIAVTASFGVAQFYDHENLSELIKEADKALYYAKNNGRNRVETLDALS